MDDLTIILMQAVGLIIFVVIIVVVFNAIRKVWRNAALSENKKWGWTFIVLWLNLIGAVLYYLLADDKEECDA